MCGQCSINGGYSLLERKEMAFDFRWFTVYKCSECGTFLYRNEYGYFHSYDVDYIQSLADCDIDKTEVLIDLKVRELILK